MSCNKASLTINTRKRRPTENDKKIAEGLAKTA